MPRNGYIDSTKGLLLDFEKIKNYRYFSKKKFSTKIATPPWKTVGLT